MTDDERAALDALRTFALAVQAYHAVVRAYHKAIDADAEFSRRAYVDAANAMDAAEIALLDAAAPLLDHTD